MDSPGQAVASLPLAGSTEADPVFSRVLGRDSRISHQGGSPMTRLNGWKAVSTVLTLCVATAAPAQIFTTLEDFDLTNGASSYAPLVQGRDGSLYGTASSGGAYNAGEAFAITPEGTLAILHSFSGERNGFAPATPLAFATDGNSYGTTQFGGSDDEAGTLFVITGGGKFANVESFVAIASGGGPSGVIQGIDGNLYGTTYIGGAGGYGTIFKVTPDRSLIVLYSFCLQSGCPDGASPQAGLIQGTDGNLYGTTAYGGINDPPCNDGPGCGTVFKIDTAGHLTTLHMFDYLDGQYPSGGLVQSTHGDFYGTTHGGVGHMRGTVFKITPGGTLTTLYNFCSQSSCPDGQGPSAALIQATDGNFYGTTEWGGANGNYGTLFRITPGGTLTTLYSFCAQPGCTDGESPNAALVQATNGIFYGTTLDGGGAPECDPLFHGCGTIFSLDMGLGPFVTFVRAAGKVGETGPILGQGFTGTSSVSINGIQANFTVVSDTYLTATVPVGATTGYVTVTTPSGTLTSNKPFHVIP
jgi:uncharacterized repeat protein (TIGR03803 family)